MNDDWRLRIEVHEAESASKLTDRLEARELQHDLEASFHDRLIVSADGSEVFCYAGTREQAEDAAKLIGSLADEHGWHLSTMLERWHPTAEEWEDPDKPLPSSDADQAAEHEELTRSERADSAAEGYPEWEVRVELASHHDAVRLAERLRSEGIPSVRRWKYLLVGASDEDSAQRLADRIQSEAPAGSTEAVEGTLRLVLSNVPRDPFVIF